MGGERDGEQDSAFEVYVNDAKTDKGGGLSQGRPGSVEPDAGPVHGGARPRTEERGSGQIVLTVRSRRRVRCWRALSPRRPR